MLKNSITGFVDPKHKYHKLVGINSDKEFRNKWALQKKLKDCLEIFFEVKFEEELTVYKINNGEKKVFFRCDNYALINNHHVDFEYNGPDHYNSTFKIHTDKRKAETLQNAEKNVETIMPGFTHLKNAQPISFAHYLLAYFEMFKRDKVRFTNNLKSLNENPLGVAAFAGTSQVVLDCCSAYHTVVSVP